MFGDGVERDAAKAVELFKIAAANGNSKAQTSLAKAYYRGMALLKVIKRRLNGSGKVLTRVMKSLRLSLVFSMPKA